MIVSLIKRWLRAVALLGALGLVAVGLSAAAQDATPAPSPAGEVEGLAFPIPELGDCSDMGTCMDYCEDPVNHTSCVAYAKEKGFYEDDPVIAAPDDFWATAQTELGCDSRESCETHCSDEANYATCHAFAAGHGVPGGYTVDPEKEAILAAAETALGCADYAACRDFCADAANATQCSNFADQVGLHGGEDTAGPGGCATPETCQLYCSDPSNFAACTAAVPPDQGTFHGPGGCDSGLACTTYCEENSDECRTYEAGANGVYVAIACETGQEYGPGGVCTAREVVAEAGTCAQGGQYWDGTACQDSPPPGIEVAIGAPYFEPRSEMGGCDTPAACYDYCSTNAAACPGFDPASRERPPETYHPYVYYTPGEPVRFEPIEAMGGCDSPGGCYDYCTENAGTCDGFDPESPRPVDVYGPGIYHTPPAHVPYFTPSEITFYVTPYYYSPPADGGRPYLTPSYYTPGMYATPNYYTPRDGSYTTPNYYTPGQYYVTPSGDYPTPSYTTPRYYSPPYFGNYSTPSYYTPPTYVSPSYYTPPPGSNYTTPVYNTPPTYSSPSYFTPPGIYLGHEYNTPFYYTPPRDSGYTTPSYVSPSYYTPGGYYTPSYLTPSNLYETPVYYSPHGSYTTPNYYTPPPGSNYTTPSYPSPSYYSPYYNTPTYHTPPEGSTYTSPSYYSPYASPAGYATPGYVSPTYSTPYYSPGTYVSPSGSYGTPPTYPYPTPSTSGTYYYPTPTYYYPTPEGGVYGTPTGYGYPSPSYPTPTSYGTPSYPTPSTTYGTPSYATPSTYGTPSYATPSSYGTPSYGTPADSYHTPSYGTPSYGTPDSYGTPSYGTPSGGEVHGTQSRSFFYWLRSLWQ
ncbi:MAG: hypothetical protein HY372_01410 [Candidatus Andersenbacteria bacterium]|nr:hypothetical protein [Candidatus Andersenbacteria bacterium]